MPEKKQAGNYQTGFICASARALLGIITVLNALNSVAQQRDSCAR